MRARATRLFTEADRSVCRFTRLSEGSWKDSKRWLREHGWIVGYTARGERVEHVDPSRRAQYFLLERGRAPASKRRRSLSGTPI